jgi:thiamine pyrophosphate-dependent acetolactate synthase large subunit-like protein
VILGKAEEEFKAFIEKINLPAAATVMGLSALPTITNYTWNAGNARIYAPM